MNGEAETNNDIGDASISNDKDQSSKKKEEEETTKDDDDCNNKFLLSHIQPPSHILSDGRFINLPPPSTNERSTFFERAVALHSLIVGDDENKIKRKSGSNKKRSSDDIDDTDASTTTSFINNGSEKRRKKETSTTKSTNKNDGAPYVHPLAIASARLRAKGMDELSKSINLGGLVIGGEYFGLSNIVNQRMLTNGGSGANTDGDEEKAKDTQSTAAATATATNDDKMTIKNESIILADQRLRSNYVLQTRQLQYNNASTVLSRHTKRLSTSISAMRIIDDRLLNLRKQWRLVAPEHGTKTFGPVRPKEVVAVDVEVYDRDRLGGGGGGGGGTSSTASSLGRIARRVPRFATLELDDEYNISMDIQSLRKKVKDVMVGLKKVNDDDEEEESSSTAEMEVEKQETSNITTQISTKAEPFATADPTLGKIDVDFNPDKVPLLTLLFEIEKPSTGFVECATLSSSSFLSSAGVGVDNNDSNVQKEDEKKKRSLQPDERVIEALQHSLFCASLFESMRAEIIPSTSSTQTTNVASYQLQQQRHKSVAWLSSEMEESFLPPPFSMAGEDAANHQTGGDSQLLCVIHCHEGELKIQLDDEYSLTVKLVEAGTAAEAGTRRSSDSVKEEGIVKPSTVAADSSGIRTSSGSQSPAQLKILCRALLLRSQTLYHEHCMKTKMGNIDSSTLQKKEEEKPPMGFARIKKEVKVPSPHILQKCVGLGCKFILEKKVRLVLRVSCLYQSHSSLLFLLLHCLVT